MQDNLKCSSPQLSRKYSEEELCCTVFYMARYAEALEIDKAITVEDERELFWMILEWSKEFEQSYDPICGGDYQMALASSGSKWLRKTFPYDPSIEEDEVPVESADGSMEIAMTGI